MIGKFQAKIADYGVSETKTGNPQVFVKFAFQNDGAAVEKVWYGSFVGGAKDITLKTLVYCGLLPQNYGNLANFVNGVSSNLLDLTKTLELDMQEEPKQDGSGVRTIVQWVNDPAMAPAVKKIDQAKNAQYFGAMNFSGDLMRLAGEMGVPLNNGGSNTMGNNVQNNNGQNQNMNNGQNNMNANNGSNNTNANNGQNNMNNGQNQNANNYQTMNGNQNQNNDQNQNMNNGQNQNVNQNQNQNMNNGQNQNQNQNMNNGQNNNANNNNNGQFAAPF